MSVSSLKFHLLAALFVVILGLVWLDRLADAYPSSQAGSPIEQDAAAMQDFLGR